MKISTLPPSDPSLTPLSGMEQVRILMFNIPTSAIDLNTCFLARAPFQVEACTHAADLIPRLDQTAYKMIILNLPSGGFEPRDIIYTLRHEKHFSSKAILVVLAPDEKIAEYQPYLAKGLSALFPLSAPAANLETALAALLQVSPRVEIRIMVRLSAKVHQQASKYLCQALNISRTGMLVGTNLTLPTGSEVTFELLLPNQPMPITGEAKVARSIRGAGNHSAGLGLTFTSFKLDGRTRLDAFLKLAAPKT